MSVLIKGDIGLPRDCCKCPFNCYGLCLANHSKLSVDKCVKSRHSDCPLVEVPTPHGRLIDCERATFPTAFRYNTNDYAKGWNACIKAVQTAPTIIEAEVSDNAN